MPNPAMLALLLLSRPAAAVAQLRLSTDLLGTTPPSGAPIRGDHPAVLLVWEVGAEGTPPPEDVELRDAAGQRLATTARRWREGDRAFAEVRTTQPVPAALGLSVWAGGERHASHPAGRAPRGNPGLPDIDHLVLVSGSWTCGWYRELRGTVHVDGADLLDVELARVGGRVDRFTAALPALRVSQDQSTVQARFEPGEVVRVRVRGRQVGGDAGPWSASSVVRVPEDPSRREAENRVWLVRHRSADTVEARLWAGAWLGLAVDCLALAVVGWASASQSRRRRERAWGRWARCCIAGERRE